MSTQRCANCNRLVYRPSTRSSLRRGLCKVCYSDEDIRQGYNEVPRGYASRGLGRIWQAHETCILMEMFRRGATDREIAAKLGRSAMSVRLKRRRMYMLTPESRRLANARRIQYATNS